MYLIQKSEELTKQILMVTLSIDDSRDRLNWRASVDGELTSKIAYNTLHISGPKVRV